LHKIKEQTRKKVWEARSREKKTHKKLKVEVIKRYKKTRKHGLEKLEK
jgi:hypothetical protein